MRHPPLRTILPLSSPPIESTPPPLQQGSTPPPPHDTICDNRTMSVVHKEHHEKGAMDAGISPIVSSADQATIPGLTSLVFLSTATTSVRHHEQQPWMLHHVLCIDALEQASTKIIPTCCLPSHSFWHRVVRHVLGCLRDHKIVPWVQSWFCTRHPRNLVTGQSYRGINSILLYAYQTNTQCHEPYYATYLQIREEQGKLKCGSQSIHLMNYVPRMHRRRRAVDRGSDTEEEHVDQPVMARKFFIVYNVALCAKGTTLCSKLRAAQNRDEPTPVMSTHLDESAVLMELLALYSLSQQTSPRSMTIATPRCTTTTSSTMSTTVSRNHGMTTHPGVIPDCLYDADTDKKTTSTHPVYARLCSFISLPKLLHQDDVNVASPPSLEFRPRYNTVTDTITIPPCDTFVHPSHYVWTLCYLLAHSTAHSHRCNRTFDSCCHDLCVLLEDAICATVASMLCHAMHVAPTDWHLPDRYLDVWEKLIRTNPRLMVQWMGRAHQAYDYLMHGKTLYDHENELREQIVTRKRRRTQKRKRTFSTMIMTRKRRKRQQEDTSNDLITPESCHGDTVEDNDVHTVKHDAIPTLGQQLPPHCNEQDVHALNNDTTCRRHAHDIADHSSVSKKDCTPSIQYGDAVKECHSTTKRYCLRDDDTHGTIAISESTVNSANDTCCNNKNDKMDSWMNTCSDQSSTEEESNNSTTTQEDSSSNDDDEDTDHGENSSSGDDDDIVSRFRRYRSRQKKQ